MEYTIARATGKLTQVYINDISLRPYHPARHRKAAYSSIDVELLSISGWLYKTSGQDELAVVVCIVRPNVSITPNIHMKIDIGAIARLAALRSAPKVERKTQNTSI